MYSRKELENMKYRDVQIIATKEFCVNGKGKKDILIQRIIDMQQGEEMPDEEIEENDGGEAKPIVVSAVDVVSPSFVGMRNDENIGEPQPTEEVEVVLKPTPEPPSKPEFDMSQIPSKKPKETVEEMIRRVYWEILHRAVDDNGLANYKQQIRDHGVRDEDHLRSILLSSPERKEKEKKGWF